MSKSFMICFLGQHSIEAAIAVFRSPQSVEFDWLYLICGPSRSMMILFQLRRLLDIADIKPV